MAVAELLLTSVPQRAVSLDRHLLALAALLFALVAVYERRQADPDMWGHLRYGQFFAENGLQTSADPFAYTSEGMHWHAHEWLAQWLLWQSYATAGAAGLLILKCFVGGVAVWFVYCLIRLGSDDARVWAPLLMLTAGILCRSYLFRPQLFTFCLFAYTLFVLFGYLLGRSRQLWTLPVVLLLWANLHAGFLAGLGAIGLALALRLLQCFNREGLRSRALWNAARPLGLTLLVSGLATLLTPFGLDLWRYVITELSHNTNRELVDEWMPLLRFEPHGWTVLTVFLLLGVLVFVGVLAQLRVRLVAGVQPWAWLLVCLPLTWMTFGSIRHVPVLTIFVAPIIALLAQAAAEAWSESRVWQTGWLAVTGLIFLPTLLTLYFVAGEPQVRIRPGRYPYGVVAFVRANGLHGNVYAPLEWGSFLTWELYPQVRVAMDGRNVTLFPSPQVRESLSYYLFEGVDPAIPLQYPTDYLLVSLKSPVLRVLKSDSRWLALYEDADAILFVRADEAHADVVARQRAGELWTPRTEPPICFE